MFSDRRAAAMLPATDVERAKKWYADTLGLSPKSEDPSGVQYAVGDGTEFWIYPSQFAGTNQATAMGFLAKDLSAEMTDLKSRGVTFEEYDIPGVKTVDGIAEFGPGESGVPGSRTARAISWLSLSQPGTTSLRPKRRRSAPS